MDQKAFTYRLVFGLILALLLIAATNAYFDARWLTGTQHTFNKKRPVFDERSQKSNFLIYQKPEYNNLILGSSRASYFPTKNLKGKWFNYAVSGMYPDEYLGYAKIAEQKATNQKLDTILIGLDFWATCQCAIVKYKKPEIIYTEAKSRIMQATNLISYDAIRESIKTTKINYDATPNEAYYLWPNLTKNRTDCKTETKKLKLKEQLWYYRTDAFGDAYKFDSNYLKPLKELIEAFPKTHFIFYNSPVSPALEALKTELGRTNDERKWLEQLRLLDADLIILETPKFDSEMFFDSHHLKPEYFYLISNEV